MTTSLKDRIDKLVLEEELNSLRFFSKNMGISEMEIINEVFGRFRSAMDEQKEFYQKELAEENVEHLIGEKIFKKNSVESPEDFFAYYKDLETYYKESCIETIVTTVPYIIPSTFLQGIKSEAQIRHFSSFLNQIPLINTFDKTNFDQNVILEVGTEPVYVIRNYFLLDVLLTYYICPLFINTTFVDKEIYITKGPEYYHLEKVAGKLMEVANKYRNDDIYTLEALQEWEKDDYYKDFSFTTKLYNLDLYYGAKFFSFFHEFSHIILNHFNTEGSNFKIELEADIMALNLLTTNTIDYYREHIGKDQVYDNVVALRIVSPLLYFLFKISFNENDLDLSPTYITRFSNAKVIVDNLIKLNSLSDFGLKLTQKIEEILLYVFEKKQIDFDKTKAKLAEEQQLIEREIERYIFSRGKGVFVLKNESDS